MSPGASKIPRGSYAVGYSGATQGSYSAGNRGSYAVGYSGATQGSYSGGPRGSYRSSGGSYAVGTCSAFSQSRAAARSAAAQRVLQRESRTVDGGPVRSSESCRSPKGR